MSEAAARAVRRPRPKYLSLQALLFEIRLPVTGWVSILHRISGALLFLVGIPVLLSIVGRTRASADSYAALQGWLAAQTH